MERSYSLVLAGLVVTVNIGLEVQAAVLVHPGGEIDDVHRDLLLELDVFLDAGSAWRWPIDRSSHSGYSRSTYLRELLRFLDANAAVTERARRLAEEVVCRRVVQIHVVRIRKQELHVTERVAGSRDAVEMRIP